MTGITQDKIDGKPNLKETLQVIYLPNNLIKNFMCKISNQPAARWMD